MGANSRGGAGGKQTRKPKAERGAGRTGLSSRSAPGDSRTGALLEVVTGLTSQQALGYNWVVNWKGSGEEEIVAPTLSRPELDTRTLAATEGAEGDWLCTRCLNRVAHERDRFCIDGNDEFLFSNPEGFRFHIVTFSETCGCRENGAAYSGIHVVSGPCLVLLPMRAVRPAPWMVLHRQARVRRADKRPHCAGVVCPKLIPKTSIRGRGGEKTAGVRRITYGLACSEQEQEQEQV